MKEDEVKYQKIKKNFVKIDVEQYYWLLNKMYGYDFLENKAEKKRLKNMYPLSDGFKTVSMVDVIWLMEKFEEFFEYEKQL